jgi:hypothetical protein
MNKSWNKSLNNINNRIRLQILELKFKKVNYNLIEEKQPFIK